MQENGAARRGERAGCRKLEGRRSRPGLVLGLADSLALSQRNASNAGEPLLPPSLLAALSVVSFSRSSWEPSVSLSPSLSLSSSLYLPLSLFLPPRASLSFSSLSPSSRWKERRRRTFVASHTTQLFRLSLSLSPEQSHYTILLLSLSLPPFLHRSLAIKFCVFQRAPHGIRKRNATRQNSGKKIVRTRARPRINSPQLFCQRARIECAWKLACRLGEGRPET